MKADIYICTDTNSLGKCRKVRYMYQLEAIGAAGKILGRLEGSGALINSTANEASLEALIHAMERFNEACNITIHTTNMSILNTLRNNMLTQWEKNGWRRMNGNVLQNAELWKHYMELTRRQLPDRNGGMGIHAVAWTNNMYGRDRAMRELMLKEEEPC